MDDYDREEKERTESNNVLLKLMNGKFEILSSHVRLSIMLILNSQKKVKVTDLVQLFNLSSGKLDHHIKMLEKDQLIIKKMELFPSRARSVVLLSKKGETLLEEYFFAMKEVFKQIFG